MCVCVCLFTNPLSTIEETKENEYSPEVLEFLSHAKTNGIHSVGFVLFIAFLRMRVLCVSYMHKG